MSGTTNHIQSTPQILPLFRTYKRVSKWPADNEAEVEAVAEATRQVVAEMLKPMPTSAADLAAQVLGATLDGMMGIPDELVARLRQIIDLEADA